LDINVYILIQVEKGAPWNLAEEISKIKEIKNAHTVTGQYDIIAYATLENLHLLQNLLKKIHDIGSIKHSQTAVCIP
jgi:DNA-binding Lrp family transcriptional regulator